MPLYVFRITQEHATFRVPSLLSISQVYGFPIRFVSEDKTRGVLVLELEKEEDVDKILERETLVMSVAELYAEGATYDELRINLESSLAVLDPYKYASFKMSMESANHNVPERRQRETFESLSYTKLEGKILMKSPDVEFVIYEDYDLVQANSPEERLARDGNFVRVYFGRKIGHGRARQLVISHSVKTRAYFGNTAMEAQMGFLMAGQALPAPGKLIYDPFVGTGSMLYSCAHWGAYVMGSDIDGRQIRGKKKGKGVKPGILRSAEQYGTADQFLDFGVYDVTKSPIRRGGWLDAIITDPPYGVRAGAKRLGKAKRAPREEPYLLPDGTYSHLNPDYLPPSRPYELANLTLDLILLARWLLVPRGRLVFFLPTVNEDYDEIDVPQVEGMRELKIGEGSVQDFGKWGRRLITMEKTAENDGPPPTFEDHEEFEEGGAEKLPGHFGFNKRYMSGFAPKSENASPTRIA
ncbi:hypothetical protein IAT38_003024 [Cryptococcus sp. DSM 104549]